MSFIRRIFYETSTGNVLLSYSIEDAAYIRDEAAEFDFHPELAAFLDEQDRVGMLEWTAPDESIEAQFAGGSISSVDVSTTPPSPVFTPYPPSDPDALETQSSGIIGYLMDGESLPDLPEAQQQQLLALRSTMETMWRVMTPQQIAALSTQPGTLGTLNVRA